MVKKGPAFGLSSSDAQRITGFYSKMRWGYRAGSTVRKKRNNNHRKK